jgi:hypothetical protein
MRRLLDGVIEVVRPITLHQPELGESPDHGPGAPSRRRVDGVRDAFPCQRRIARSDRSEIFWRAIRFVHGGVVARDLLDHAHDRCFLAVTQEVPPIRLADAFHWGIVVRMGERRILVRCREPLLLDFGNLSEQLLLGSEVVVVRAVRDPCALRDVGDPRVEESIVSEDHVLVDNVRHFAQAPRFAPGSYGTVRRTRGSVMQPALI